MESTISYCPYRIQINHDWSSLQTTAITDPVMYSGAVMEQKYDTEKILNGPKFPYQDEGMSS